MHYTDLLIKLTKIGWCHSLHPPITKGKYDIEAITHEIAHVVTCDKKPDDFIREYYEDRWADNLQGSVADLIDNTYRLDVEKDENEFLTSLITREVLHRLGITDLDETEVFRNLCMNLVGKKYFGNSVLTQRKQVIRRDYNKMAKTHKGTVELHADQIMAYYREVMA